MAKTLRGWVRRLFVASKGAGFTSGGYIVSVLDAKGGFGVSILGKDGTRVRAIALANVVASHR